MPLTLGERLLPYMDYQRAYKYSLNLLSKKDYSRAKLKEKLFSKEYHEEDIENVIKVLLEKKYLREDYYIEARVKAFIRKGYSKKMILQKLEQEQCYSTEEVVQNIYRELGTSEQKQIEQLVSKKMTSYRGQYPKLLRFLMSKGHQLELIYKVIPPQSN